LFIFSGSLSLNRVEGTFDMLCGPICYNHAMNCKIPRLGRISVALMRHKETTNLTCSTSSVTSQWGICV